MIKLAADENFDDDILRGLLRRLPALDVLRVSEENFRGAPDPIVLEWAASEGRVLVTHDRETMPDFAFERVRAGQPMAGVFLVSNQITKGNVIDELLLAVECLSEEECRDRVIYFPL